MEKKTKILLNAVFTGIVAAMICHDVKKRKQKETTQDVADNDQMDRELEEAFDESSKVDVNERKTPTLSKDFDMNSVNPVKSDSNYIIVDKDNKFNETFANSFMLNGYRIYTIPTGAKLHESFSMPRFLREKSILFITCKQDQISEAAKIADKMKEDAEQVYKNAASSGISSEYRHVTIISDPA